MAHHEAGGAHRTADDEYLGVPGSAYEHTDANVWAIVKFAVWLVATALVVHVGMGLMYGGMVEQAKEPATSRRYPLASSDSPALPPAPRLQESPSHEVRDFRASEEQRLHEYGWVDKAAGVVHIPIEEAMRLTVERNPPARAETPGQTGGSTTLASDASAGRVMEKRR